MAKDLLLEIGTEEIPAGFITLALEQLKNQLVPDIMKDNLIYYNEIKVWGTPRRLSLYLAGVSEHQSTEDQLKFGPHKNIARDQNGNWSKAAIKFAESQGKTVNDLKTGISPKPEHICLSYTKGGNLVIDVLPQIMPRIIQSVSFPKSMRWGDGEFGFARPIHWILALFDEKVIRFEVAGIKSGNYSFGHRFLSKSKLPVPSSGKYLSILEQHSVFVNQDQRKAKIENQLKLVSQQLAKQYPGAHVVADEELLNEVSYLVEYPVAIAGHFDREFLQLPREVLICAMRQHQRYFVIEDEAGSLSPAFVVISNMPDGEQGFIRRGNERVLRARLADARFFYDEDLKKRLTERIEDLKGMTYQQKLGTYYDKTQRIITLAKYIAQELDLNDKKAELITRAAQLCKCDLLTEMVGEFPKLQGITGREYARQNGEEDEVAQAISEHYLPRFVGDTLPETITGAILSLADKLDTITGCFGVGLIPTSSQDPYGLRRQAGAIIRIIIEKSWHLSLKELIDKTLDLLSDKITRPRAEVKQQVEQFYRSSLFIMLGTSRIGSAVTKDDRWDDAYDALQRWKALDKLRENLKDDFESLMIGFRRVARIIPKDYSPVEIKPDLFAEQAEGILYNSFLQLKDRVGRLLAQRDYDNALSELAGLRPDIDRFFDDVLVMTDDINVRNNRLALLSGIKNLFSPIADFSIILT